MVGHRSRWLFPTPVPAAPFGSWTLLEPDAEIPGHLGRVDEHPFGHGEARFVEDREAPPKSRAI